MTAIYICIRAMEAFLVCMFVVLVALHVLFILDPKFLHKSGSQKNVYLRKTWPTLGWEKIKCNGLNFKCISTVKTPFYYLD